MALRTADPWVAHGLVVLSGGVGLGCHVPPISKRQILTMARRPYALLSKLGKDVPILP